jgi:hypothetical protein
MNPETDDNFNPVLLSKSELQWLHGDIKVSKSYEYKIKSSIKRKIQTLTELEIPLLFKSNFFVNSDSKVDDGLGRDLEPEALSYPSDDAALDSRTEKNTISGLNQKEIRKYTRGSS